MNQSVLEIPVLEIVHLQTDDFKRVFKFLKPDGTYFNIDDTDPVLTISKSGTVILTFEGSDFTKTLNSEIVLKKPSSVFAGMDCLTDYTFRFFDRTSNSTLVKGPFKIV